MFKLSTLVACLALAFPLPAAADSIEATGTCLTDSTSGRDRKVLVKWIFLAISRHPDISDMATASPEAMEQINIEVGKLYTRLIAEDCPTEIRAMLKEHGPAALSKPFEVLGAVAMRELMSHAAVSEYLFELEQHTDSKRIGEVIRLD